MMNQHVAQLVDENGKLPAYAWPGGYQMFYLDKHNAVLCPDCANEVAQETEDDWYMVVAYDVNYEDPFLVCDNCNKHIDPSYMTEEELELARYGNSDE